MYIRQVVSDLYFILVNKTRAKLADLEHLSYFLGELYNNVPYTNNKTVDYYFIIYILIIIYIFPARL